MQQRFERPASIAQAARLLAASRWAVLAGGTDLYPAHVGKPIALPLLDITGIAELRGDTSGGSVAPGQAHGTVRQVVTSSGTVLDADFVIAGEQARFKDPFTDRGFSVDSGGSWLLPRLIGLTRAKRFL